MKSYFKECKSKEIIYLKRKKTINDRYANYKRKKGIAYKKNILTSENNKIRNSIVSSSQINEKTPQIRSLQIDKLIDQKESQN